MATQPVSLNGIEFDALMKYERKYEASIPDYPTEDGYSVQDSIILNPVIIEATLFLTNTPVTWARRFGNQSDRMARVAKELESLFFEKKPVTFKTSEKTWTNMGIVSLTVPRVAEMKNACEIEIQLKEIRITKAKTTVIPASYGKSGTTGANAGTTQTKAATTSTSKTEQKAQSQKSASILFGAANSVGLIKR